MFTVLGLILLASPPPPTPTPAPVPTVRPAPVRRATGAPSNSLAEVAAKTRLRGGQGGIVITNDNLQALAGGVELTSASGGGAQLEATPQAAAGTRRWTASGEAALQRLWQQRYQRARGYLRFLENEETRLNREVERLKTAFYAEDDGFRRDAEIKPAWDEALAQLTKTRQLLAEKRTLPDEVVQAALREGALPGWFRGLPEPAPVSSPPELESQMPPIPSPSRRESF